MKQIRIVVMAAVLSMILPLRPMLRTIGHSHRGEIVILTIRRAKSRFMSTTEKIWQDRNMDLQTRPEFLSESSRRQVEGKRR